MMSQCKKIGEGVYGEVFRTQSEKNSVALKVSEKLQRKQSKIYLFYHGGTFEQINRTFWGEGGWGMDILAAKKNV